MRIDTQTKEKWVMSDDISEEDIQVDPKSMSKIIGLLTKQIYTSPASAAREYWLNARESHDTATGNKDASQGQMILPPVMITLPDMNNNHNYYNYVLNIDYTNQIDNYTMYKDDSRRRDFSIRDYGTGLSEEELYKMISTAGKSSKTNDNLVGGGMGIGSLSGFSVANQIVYNAYKDGVESTVILSSENNKIVRLPSKETSEKNGVKVSFQVKQEKSAAFVKGIIEYLAYAPTDERAEIIADTETINLMKDLRYSGSIPRDSKGLTIIPESLREASLSSSNSSYEISILVNGCYYTGKSDENIVEKIAGMINKRLVKNTNLFNGSSNLDNIFFYELGRISHMISNHIWSVPVGFFNFDQFSPSREVIKMSSENIKEFSNLIIDKMSEVFDYTDKYAKLAEDFFNDPSMDNAIRLLDYTYNKTSKDLDVYDWIISRFVLSISKLVNDKKNLNKIGFEPTSLFKYDRLRQPSIVFSDLITKPAKGHSFITLNDDKDKIYSVTTSMMTKNNGKISLSRSEFKYDVDKTYNILSTSNSIDTDEWEYRVSLIQDNISKIKDAETKNLMKEISDVDNNDLRIISTKPKIITSLDDLSEKNNFTYNLLGKKIDGKILRTAWGIVNKKENEKKKTGPKYRYALVEENKSISYNIDGIKEIIELVKENDAVVFHNNYNDKEHYLSKLVYPDRKLVIVTTNSSQQDVDVMFRRFNDNGVKINRVEDYDIVNYINKIEYLGSNMDALNYAYYGISTPNTMSAILLDNINNIFDIMPHFEKNYSKKDVDDIKKFIDQDLKEKQSGYNSYINGFNHYYKELSSAHKKQIAKTALMNRGLGDGKVILKFIKTINTLRAIISPGTIPPNMKKIIYDSFDTIWENS